MQHIIEKVLTQIESVVLGKPRECRLALACLLAKGHLLIEDLPGMGKTTLAHQLAISLGLSYQRTQFTSDLLPSDVIGVSIFNQDTKTFELHKGPVFNQVVLGDEINRASPKTQSALLEAMAENQVSIDGVTYDLPTPFFVIATQNPLFHSGTYPLPESQLDRFMMRLSLGFPDLKAEKKILQGSDDTITGEHPNVLNSEQLIEMQQAVQNITVSSDVIDYVIALCQVSRYQFMDDKKLPQNKAVLSSGLQCAPLSPRAGKSLLAAAKAWAYIDDRDYVLPDDIQAVFYEVCQHRLEPQQYQNTAGSSSAAKQILGLVDVLNPLAY
ncbi:AAA family ATPase [Litorilituus lipolyticus]|uniref:AAA family ATPase n=1 Tax=Litorilituus lipolyticus TaxID=2491017 RepID=A0A502KR93_9GAMM|nr:AAA family ATPase [Litorilituus lipolyticus]TPH12839.1 AAA family ATPase [Litorilituus lipolyticus]